MSCDVVVVVVGGGGDGVCYYFINLFQKIRVTLGYMVPQEQRCLFLPVCLAFSRAQSVALFGCQCVWDF